jgi:proteic killer suppression protein
MIRSYRDSDTEQFAADEKIRRWEPFRRQAEKRLRIFEAATSLGDLAALNFNRLEALKGNRKGQYSIRINDQWRICFT